MKVEGMMNESSAATPRATDPKYCSFCGRHHSEVKVLVASQVRFKALCDRCHAKCVKLMEEAPDGLISFDSAPTVTPA